MYGDDCHDNKKILYRMSYVLNVSYILCMKIYFSKTENQLNRIRTLTRQGESTYIYKIKKRSIKNTDRGPTNNRSYGRKWVYHALRGPFPPLGGTGDVSYINNQLCCTELIDG